MCIRWVEPVAQGGWSRLVYNLDLVSSASMPVPEHVLSTAQKGRLLIAR